MYQTLFFLRGPVLGLSPGLPNWLSVGVCGCPGLPASGRVQREGEDWSIGSRVGGARK